MSRLSLENLFKSFEADEDQLVIDVVEGDDDAVALTDATDDLAGAEQIDDGIGHSFESIVLMDKLSKRYKKKYGMESDESAAVEATETPAEEAAEVVVENEGGFTNEGEPTEEEMKTVQDSESVSDSGEAVSTEGVFNIGSDPKFLKIGAQNAYTDTAKTFAELKKDEGLGKIIEEFKKYYKEKKKWDATKVTMDDVEASNKWGLFTKFVFSEGGVAYRNFDYEYKKIDGCLFAIYRVKANLGNKNGDILSTTANTRKMISRIYLFFKDENGKLQWKLVARIKYTGLSQVKKGKETFESVDLSLVNGSEGTVTMEGAGDFFKKIGSYIALAFKKLIAALMNFMKSVMIWMSGPAVANQDKVYSERFPTLKADLAKYGDKEVRLPPKPAVRFEAVYKNIDDLTKNVKGVNDAVIAKMGIFAKIARKFANGVNANDEKFAATADAKRLIQQFDASYKEKVKSLSAKDYVASVLYGDEVVEVKARKIKDVYNVENFKDLTKANAGQVKELVNTARDQVKAIEQALKAVSQEVDWEAAGLQTDVTLVVNKIRSYLTSTSSMILSTYLEYLRYRSYLYRALVNIGEKPATATVQHNVSLGK